MLTAEQRRAYDEQGYLLVSELIPPETAAAAEAAMWRLIGASPDDPASWSELPRGHASFENPELVACYTPEYRSVAALLAGDDPAIFQAPRRGYAINVFPQAGSWVWPRPHIDHAIKEHGHRTFPRAFRIAAMTFLNDVPPHGGGTVVWPASHQKIEALARSDPERYELMWTLGQALRELDLGEPVETTPRRGDVLFYHYLCAHAGSMNTSERPRLAMNMKW
jgi:ectoine hydroxylase-related dioxygenase (phytanoyl-CoA dioxygenase family)